jgi:sugar lactone lactonase YvrE
MRTVPLNLAVAAGVLLAGAVAGRSQTLQISTLAGRPVPGSSDGAGHTARFTHPCGVTADAAGNVFVTDTGNHTIRKITPDRFVSTISGSSGNAGSADGTGTNAQFHAPQGIAVDGAGNLYVADTANATIRKITPAGVVTTLAGVAGNVNSFDGNGSAARFNRPQAVAVNTAGNVLVADTMNHTLRVITPAGAVSTLAGLAGYSGSADGTNNKARFNRPAGIVRDGANNLFVTDFLNHTIRRITPDGTVSTIAGLAGVWGHADGTNRAARFFQPHGIATDSAGNLVVVDSGNQTLRRISASGTNWVVTTVAGFPGRAGNMDGSGSATQFYFPAGAALDGSGRLYVADIGNNSIRTDRLVPPTLQFLKSANQLVLSWPAAAGGYVLEAASTISTSAVWIPLTNGVAVTAEGFVLTNTLAAAKAFYRLREQ